MSQATSADHTDTNPALVSALLGDIPAKVAAATRAEYERRLRRGLPVIVDRGHGVEDLNARIGQP